MSDPTTPADCPNCNGEGAVRAMTYGHGPDDYEYDADCPACHGTGSADLADAINALPYQQHTVKPHTEMVSRAAVLEIIKARAAAQPAPAPSVSAAPRIDPLQDPMRPGYFMNYAENETPAEMVLRKLACWLGVGGYNAPTVDADLFHRKIVDGVQMLLAATPQPAPAAVPAGWKLVPVEPTPEMRNAFHAVTEEEREVKGAAGSRWAAMLAAAPAPATGGEHE